MRRAIRVATGLLLALLATMGLTAGALLASLRASPGEWSHALALGPWEMKLSMPALLRMASHPLVLRALDGRTLHTRLGEVHWQTQVQPPGWRAVCAPCRVPSGGPGRENVLLDRVELVARRESQGEWRGEFILGEAPHAVRGRFTLHLEAQGLRGTLALPDTALADAYRVFAANIPEASRATIAGRVRLQAQWRWPQREWRAQPQLEGFVVSGLGTEALSNAAVASCPTAARGFGTWLPRAVVAAEDQRFFEHSGYDLREMAAAWNDPQTSARGASTLSQQLAKLLYAGDERSPVRKLRELLYAVELDRTLGKARVLQLYLAIAPWGDGQCGAAAAARHYLHKRVDKLTPLEAAWLASLLHNPDREWAALRDHGQVNAARVAWVLENLRPMPLERREAAIEALPAWSEQLAQARRSPP